MPVCPGVASYVNNARKPKATVTTQAMPNNPVANRIFVVFAKPLTLTPRPDFKQQAAFRLRDEIQIRQSSDCFFASRKSGFRTQQI